jgi:phage-related protein
MIGLSYSQESENDWTMAPADMLYQIVQDVAVKQDPSSHSRIGEHYAQRVQQRLEQQMAQFEADHEAAVAELRRSYIFLDDRGIRSFFRSHRTTPQLLIEAVPYLRLSFGVSTLFNLRATADEYGAQELYAVVVWPGDVRDVRLALRQFDEQWWIANSRQAPDLTFTYELV